MTVREILISHLEATPLLNSRYTNIKCVNFDAAKGEKKNGNFSLVFKAHDKTEDKFVALKFFDPEKQMQAYRIKAFQREPEILRTLLNKVRCLQIQAGLVDYTIEIEAKAGGKIPLSCQYFVTEWLDEDLEDFFYQQQAHDGLNKLKIFREITLALASLHRHKIVHRDYKQDNLRLKRDRDKQVVVAIDFGTAARAEDENLLNEYYAQVGADLCSAPEAMSGFAGDREIAAQSDFYSLGCLLFELFHHDYLFHHLNQSTDHQRAKTAIVTSMAMAKDRNKLETWRSMLPKLKHMLKVPNVYSEGSSAPPAIFDQLNSLVIDLTEFDFRLRLTNFEKLLPRIESMIKILENNRLVRLKLDQRRKWRENKEKNIRMREQKFKALKSGT